MACRSYASTPRENSCLCSLAVFLCFWCLLALLPVPVLAKNGVRALAGAIEQANQNAKVCQNQSQTCTGALVTLNLTQDVKLRRPLPGLAPSAQLSVIGKCSAKKPRKCTINAGRQATIFTSTAEVDATNVLFLKNNGGAVLNSDFGSGGFPPVMFTSCTFANNTGNVIRSGISKYVLSWEEHAFYVKDSVFLGNTGGSAIQVAGRGTSVFENVQFIENVADSFGGAVYVSGTALIFRNVSFIRNIASNGSGGAMAGFSDYRGLNASFCSCSFVDNLAPEDPKANTLAFDPDGPNLPVIAAFCDTPIPNGSTFANYSQGIVSQGQGLVCANTY